MMVRILSATAEEIIIDGVVPIDDKAPIRGDGKAQSPDPLIRLCHETKKELLNEVGVCIAYCVLRPKTNGDPSVTKIKFYFSNTGDHKPSKTADRKRVRENELFFCQLMSVRCADKIVEYFDDKYSTTKNSPVS